MDILLWHEILEPYELAVKELQVKFRQGAPRKRAVLTDRERERPCEECFQYSGKNAEKGHCARRDGGAGGGYRGHPHHLPVR